VVEARISEAYEMLEQIEHVRGNPIINLDVLEIGSGQKSIQLAVMSQKNRATGIDREDSNKDLGIRGVLGTVRTDGPVRALKTVVRKGFGFDRAIKDECAKQMGLARWPPLDVRKMDAEAMSFPNNSFDVVFSRAVFEHLASPANVLKEVRRVLRPGGVFYCLLHLYTSYSGCHDVRIFANLGSAPPLWAHLRGKYRHRVIENSYLNRPRLDEWKALLENGLPGAQIHTLMDDTDPHHSSELISIRESGELNEFSDEELLTLTLKVTWKRADG
jgi:SAM-dependent methyltransferase